MKKTILINLFGSPGSGKTTAASELFFLLKKYKKKEGGSFTVETLSEHAKIMKWLDLPISVPLQRSLYFEQLQKEMQLAGCVDFLITDSPTLISSFYNTQYTTGMEWLDKIEEEKRIRFKHLDFFLPVATVYDQEGRWESQKESEAVSLRMKEFVNSRTYLTEDQNSLKEVKRDNAAKTVFDYLERRKLL